MTWPGATEHNHLLAVGERLADELESLRQRLVYGEIANMQHSEFADRASGLASYLRAVIRLTQEDLYAPALANLRSAMEYILVDQLVFLGRRYVQVISDVDEATWADWQRLRSSGEAFTTVVDWTRSRRGVVEVTHEGFKSREDEDTFLSVHYFLLQQYQPYFGSASAQEQFDSGLSNLDRDRQFARQNEDIYRTYLNWRSIKRSLKSNGFSSDIDINRLDIHYRFLSAFTHPISNVNDLIHGRNSMSVRSYDHYSSELTLLYVVVFAVEELIHFHAMTTKKPTVGIHDWRSTERLCKYAWELTSHLWFPGQRPHLYDRISEANQRMFRMFRDGESFQRVDPQVIPDEEVGYYRDPLSRLISLHSSFQEVTTGLTFVSPWPRSDAQFR